MTEPVNVSTTDGHEPAAQPPMFETLMERAIDARATDVHIDPSAEEATIRYRVDGVVRVEQRVPREEGRRLVNQIKVACKMGIDEAFAPIEGQFHWKQGGTIRDVRVTMLPTLHHEAAHLRLLSEPDQWRDIRKLGMSDEDTEEVENLMRLPQGLVLITGQAGAGKTTTLYALTTLQDLDGKVAVAVEDPIEFDVPGVRQVQVDERHDVTMASALRTLLRTDPDVLIIGEVRDRESAVTAGHAAIAGHLVLATVHARDAASAIDAMHYESVPYYVLGGALRLVIAQNLVRRICKSCREAYKPREQDVALFERFDVDVPESLYRGSGCDDCGNTGFHGRVGVFEVASFDNDLGGWLMQGRHQDEIRKRLRARGVKPIAADALRKVTAGVTAISEAARFVAE